MRRGHDGSTLIEILVTVLIMGIAFAAMLGGLTTATIASDANVTQTTAEATLRAFAEFLKRAAYVDCATASTYTGFVAPPGYTASITRIQYWDDETSTPAFVDVCPSPDAGLQLLSLRVQSSNSRADERLQMVKGGR